MNLAIVSIALPVRNGIESPVDSREGRTADEETDTRPLEIPTQRLPLRRCVAIDGVTP